MIASTLTSVAHVLLNSEGTIARIETLDDGTVVHDSTSIHVIDPGGWDRRYNLSSPVVDFLKNEEPLSRRDSLYIVLPVTIIYAVIFFSGVIGNVSTCVVIARNKSMHTATNYYLFSLAISDLLLLISGLPPEMYYIWSHFPYVFGEVFCIIQSFAAETSANATVLTITAFTVERYVAICHPFVSHTMSKLSRAVKFVVAIWLLALCLAVPQAIQFGVVYDYTENGMAIGDSARCSTKWVLIEHAFQISTMLFFVLPMTVITVLYVLIAIKLRSSRVLTAGAKKYHLSGGTNNCEPGKGKNAAQRNVVRMLVAVVVAFFICWAPFHAQRLLAVYAQSSTAEPQDALVIVYTVLTYVSGVFYYLSTTINPLLYNIMSNKFREAFKSMLSKHCGRRSRTFGSRRPTYTSTFKYQKSSIRRNYVDDHRRDSPSLSSDDNQKFVNDKGTNGNELYERKEVIESSDEKPKESMLKDQEVPLVSRTDDSRANNDVRANFDERLSRQSSDPRKLMTVAAIRKAPISEGNNNVATTRVDEYLLRVQRPSRALGLLAERLRFGTKELFAPQRKDPIETKAKVEVARYHVTPRFHSYPSIDSANTISNSSLQDLGETEFTGSELAHYMGELNFDLVA